MRTHAALVRGINVGGRNKVPMTVLRQAVASLGHNEVATYIQSGNVVFAAADPGAGTEVMATSLEAAIAGHAGVRPGVVVVSRQEMEETVAVNPFADEPDPKRVHAVFLPRPPGGESAAEVAGAVERARAKGASDHAQLVGRVLFLHTPGGYGRSPLVAELERGGRSRVTASGTARNLATVHAVLALLDG